MKTIDEAMAAYRAALQELAGAEAAEAAACERYQDAQDRAIAAGRALSAARSELLRLVEGTP